MIGVIAGAVVSLMYGSGKLEERNRREAVQRARSFEPPQIYGKGDGFTTERQAQKAGLFGFSGLRLGRHAKSGREIRVKKEGPIIGFGPTGSSKTSSIVLRNLNAKESNFINDCKGSEITLVAGRKLAAEGKYFALAPYGLGGPTPPGVKLASFNPMYPMFKPDAKRRHRAIAMTLADGVLGGEESGENAFFINGARGVFASGTIGIARYGKGSEKNLPGVANAISSNFVDFCERMIGTGDKEVVPLFRGYLEGLKSGGRGFPDILSTVKQGVEWLSDPCIAEMLSGNDFEWEQMGAEPMTVALCMPMNEVAANGKAGRLATASCLYALQTPDRPREVMVNLFLDEASSFNKLACLVAGYSTTRVFKIRMWSFWQDREQILGIYGKIGQSMINNSVAQIWFSSKSAETSSHLSQQGGKTTVITSGKNVSYDRSGWPNVSESVNIHQCEVIGVRDVADMPEDEALMWIRGVPGVLKIKHKPYFKQWRYKLHYDKNPLYRG